jgi:hypothetical protein
MSNIPGAAGVIPGVYSNVETQSSGVSVPGGTRIAAILGEGARAEVVVSTALGKGQDGYNATFSSSSGSDGRHFKLAATNLISNRTTIYRNGSPLVGLEAIIDSGAFDARYDYRLEIATGRIELQRASFGDIGGKTSVASSTNVGVGTLSNLTLVDLDAPSETWTVKCVGVQRDNSGTPVTATARFVAFGTVSGSVLDTTGNAYIWKSDGNAVSNGIVSFAVNQTSSSVVLREGDTFTFKVKSGVLLKNDSLTATYIAITDHNDPTFLTSMQDISARHGLPSLDNNLSLGCSLAFSNGTPGVMTVQCAPALPRRTSYALSALVKNTSVDSEDFIFPLPVGVMPDATSSVHFFVTNPATKVETQILPNKFAFYTLTDSSSSPSLNTFTQSTTTYAYSYSVMSRIQTVKSGADGVLTAGLAANTGVLHSSAAVFGLSDVGLTIRIFDATTSTNAGTFDIIDVTDGVLTFSDSYALITFVGDTVSFEILDASKTSSYVVVNKGIFQTNNMALRVTVVDGKDAGFFDAGWATALAALESNELDIIVPLPKQTVSAIVQNALAHCRTMSSTKNRRERVLLTGAIAGLTPANLIGTSLAAVEDIGVLEGIQGENVADILAGNTEDLTNYSVPSAFGTTFRCQYFYPDQIIVQAGADRVVVDGIYAAAAAAGWYSGTSSPAIPLTNKVLSGITIPKSKRLSPTVLENLTAAGVTVLQPVAGGGQVVWGKSTTQSGFPEEEEMSIVFIRDRIAKSMRAGFAGFVGNPEDNTLQATLTARAVGLLNSFVTQGLITAYSDLRIVRDSVDPRQWNISVRTQPSYPVNWIYVKISVGLL